MDKLEYQVIMARIKGIEQERLCWLDYICNKIDFLVDIQKDNIRERMLQLKEEKNKPYKYVK